MRSRDGTTGGRNYIRGFRLARTLTQEVAAAVAPAQPAPPPTPVRPAVGTFPSGEVTPLSPERERALKPKDVFKECDKCPEMVVVTAGSFTMGSPASEEGHSDAEGPQQRSARGSPGEDHARHRHRAVAGDDRSHLPRASLAIARAESVTELPLVGRFMKPKAPVLDSRPKEPVS